MNSPALGKVLKEEKREGTLGEKRGENEERKPKGGGKTTLK